MPAKSKEESDQFVLDAYAGNLPEVKKAFQFKGVDVNCFHSRSVRFRAAFHLSRMIAPLILFRDILRSCGRLCMAICQWSNILLNAAQLLICEIR